MFPRYTMKEYLKFGVLAVLAVVLLVLPSSALEYSDPWMDPLCSAGGGAGSFCEWFKATGASGQDAPRMTEPETEIPAIPGFPPVAFDITVATNQNTPVEITLSGKDPDGDTLAWVIETGPLHGVLGSVAGNNVVYTPGSDYAGSDWFLYKGYDGYWDSNAALVTITIMEDCGSSDPHLFYGVVTIDGRPAPESTTIQAIGEGVIQNMTGNPVIILGTGTYGSANNTPDTLAVRGCIPEGTPIRFLVNELNAEVCDAAGNGSWEPSFPFMAGGMTNLDLRVTTPSPPPDYVYITALGMSLSTPGGGITKTIRLEKEPELEITVTSGLFFIDFYAIGGHAFFGQPVLGRDATIGIYENGIPLSVKDQVWFGSSRVTYDYLANETRTFDILVFVNDDPEIHTLRHITVTTIPSKG